MNPNRFALLAGTAIMFLLVAGCSKPATSSGAAAAVDYYTCTMHPSVKSKDPGNCPICGMELVPVIKKGMAEPAATPGQVENHEFTVPTERRQQIGVTYTTVESRTLTQTIRAVGTIVPDQKRVWSFVSRVDGYVQQLFVTSPGEIVEKDASLLSIYSPELLTAEREFVMLLKSRRGGPAQPADNLLEASKLRLRQWNVTDEQIAELEKKGKPSETLTLRSPFRGVVAKVPTAQGAGVKAGDALVEVVDLSRLWVWADFYETEIGRLRTGQTVSVSSVAYPGRTFTGTIALLDPFVDPARRTARARIDVDNPEFLLRPGMYVNAELELPPVTTLAVPIEAIMPTGLRNVVFVEKGEGRIEPRFVSLGGKFGDFYAADKGLKAGERIVSSANFLIDAESKVQGALQAFADEDTGPSTDLKALAEFVQAYLSIHQKLTQDQVVGLAADTDTLRRAARTLPASLRASVDGYHPKNIEEARVGFGRISAALVTVLKEAPTPRMLYVMRCPMWNSSPSEWVQVSKEVENPFFGQAMETCGENVRTLGK